MSAGGGAAREDIDAREEAWTVEQLEAALLRAVNWRPSRILLGLCFSLPVWLTIAVDWPEAHGRLWPIREVVRCLLQLLPTWLIWRVMLSGVRGPDRSLVRAVSDCQDPRAVRALLTAFLAVYERYDQWNHTWRWACVTEALARLLPRLGREEASSLGDVPLAALRRLVCLYPQQESEDSDARIRMEALKVLHIAHDPSALPFARWAVRSALENEVGEAAAQRIPDFESYARDRRSTAVVGDPSGPAHFDDGAENSPQLCSGEREAPVPGCSDGAATRTTRVRLWRRVGDIGPRVRLRNGRNLLRVVWRLRRKPCCEDAADLTMALHGQARRERRQLGLLFGALVLIAALCIRNPECDSVERAAGLVLCVGLLPFGLISLQGLLARQTGLRLLRAAELSPDVSLVGLLLDTLDDGGFRHQAYWSQRVLSLVLPLLEPEHVNMLGERHLQALRGIVRRATSPANSFVSSAVQTAALDVLDRARDPGALECVRCSARRAPEADVRSFAERLLPNFESYAAAARVSATLVRPSMTPATGDLLRAASEGDARSEQLLRASNGGEQERGAG